MEDAVITNMCAEFHLANESLRYLNIPLLVLCILCQTLWQGTEILLMFEIYSSFISSPHLKSKWIILSSTGNQTRIIWYARRECCLYTTTFLKFRSLNRLFMLFQRFSNKKFVKFQIIFVIKHCFFTNRLMTQYLKYQKTILIVSVILEENLLGFRRFSLTF